MQTHTRRARRHPQQEGRLADRKPRDLGAIEEETRSTEDTAVIVVLGDLSAGGLVGSSVRRSSEST